MTSAPVIPKFLTISIFTTRRPQTISLIYDKVEARQKICHFIGRRSDASTMIRLASDPTLQKQRFQLS